MAQQATLAGAAGTPVKCFKRGARNLQPGDWLPEHEAHVLTEPLVDPEDNQVWVELDNGTEVSFTLRNKVWMHRTYRAPEWVQEAVEAYRGARDARDAMRESGLPAPTSVPGLAGSQVAWYQLEDDAFNAAYPAPRLSEFLKEYAAARREREVDTTAA